MAAGCVPDASPWEIPEFARAGGFDACGMWVDPATSWNDSALKNTKAALAANEIQLIDVEPLWLESEIEVQKTIIAAGIELGARNVLVVSRESDRDKSMARFFELCEFADREIRLALEFGIFTEIKTLSQALAFTRRIDHPAAGVLIDQMHLNRTQEPLPDLADPIFPYIQACDFEAASATKSGYEYIVAAVDERLPLGEGDCSVEDTNKIKTSNLDVSLEIRSKALREGYPDPKARAKQIFERCSRSITPI